MSESKASAIFVISACLVNNNNNNKKKSYYILVSFLFTDGVCLASTKSPMPLTTNMTVAPPSTDATVARDFDNANIEFCGLTPAALQNIRTQMALSLERTKELEDQVKMIPVLRVSPIICLRMIYDLKLPLHLHNSPISIRI